MKLSWISIIVFVLIICAGISYPEDKQTMVNWSYAHYDQNNQKDWDAKGETAVIREGEIDILSLELNYYLSPVSPTATSQPARKVIITAKMGSIKQQLVTLHDNIVVRKISEPPDEFDETMQASSLLVNLTDKIFFTESLITITRNDMSVKSKGCKGGLDFEKISFLGNVETVIQGCNSKSICLGEVFSPKPNIDYEEMNKTPSVITITSDGPMTVEKINGNPNKKISQQISFQNKVALNSYSQPPNSSPRKTNLRAENVDILLDRRENPVTKRNNFYLARISATNNVRIDDSFHSAACSALTADETAGLITLKGDDKSLAAINRPLKANNGQIDSYINIAAQTMKIQTEKDNILLLGRKELTFSNGSIYNPEPVSPTDTISPTDTVSLTKTQTGPANPPAGISTQIHITADNDGLISLQENQIHLENKVRITQWSTTITDSTKPELKATIKCDKLLIGWNSTKNLLDKLKAEDNVYISSDGSEAWGEIMEWTPPLSQINLKSPRKVKILHKNSSIDGDEIVITTNPQDTIGNWTNIEIKNKTNGSIKIAPKEKEELQEAPK